MFIGDMNARQLAERVSWRWITFSTAISGCHTSRAKSQAHESREQIGMILFILGIRVAGDTENYPAKWKLKHKIKDKIL